MKDLLKNGLLIVFAIGILYIIFLRECKHVDCPPEGKVLVSQKFIDSLVNIANLPPIIIIKDSIIYRDTIIYIQSPIPPPVVITPETKLYTDSIYNDSIRVWNRLLINGTVVNWEKWYQPIVHVKTITVEKPVPFPVPFEVQVNKNGLYISGLASGSANTFALGGGLDLITKKDYLYGIQYQRIGNDNYYGIRVGLKIKFKNGNAK